MSETYSDCELAKVYYEYVVKLGLWRSSDWLQSWCFFCYNIPSSKKVDFKRLKWAWGNI